MDTSHDVDEDGRQWIVADEGFMPPRGGEPVAWRMTYTPPGLPRSTRLLELKPLGPGDDRAVVKQTSAKSAHELAHTDSAEGRCGIWWMAGRQEGLRETFRELEPLFSYGHIGSGDLVLELGFEFSDDPDTEPDRSFDDEDPTKGAST
jgi:hypothetical protein